MSPSKEHIDKLIGDDPLLKGIREIGKAKWRHEPANNCYILRVHDQEGMAVYCFLSMRPPCCDRGHIMLQIDGHFDLDAQDGFPRYFFSQEEADTHTRAFLMWRIWKYRCYEHKLEF